MTAHSRTRSAGSVRRPPGTRRRARCRRVCPRQRRRSRQRMVVARHPFELAEQLLLDPALGRAPIACTTSTRSSTRLSVTHVLGGGHRRRARSGARVPGRRRRSEGGCTATRRRNRLPPRAAACLRTGLAGRPPHGSTPSRSKPRATLATPARPGSPRTKFSSARAPTGAAGSSSPSASIPTGGGRSKASSRSRASAGRRAWIVAWSWSS